MTDNENNIVISGHFKCSPHIIWQNDSIKALAATIRFNFIEEILTVGYIKRELEQSVHFTGKLMASLILVSNDDINEDSWVKVKGYLDNGNVVVQEVTYINNNNKAVTLINE